MVRVIHELAPSFSPAERRGSNSPGDQGYERSAPPAHMSTLPGDRNRRTLFSRFGSKPIEH